MRYAKCVFLLAGITGVLMVIPPYFLEQRFGQDNPPPVNHPEFYYGFFGVTLAWQFMFLVIGSDPIRFRTAMWKKRASLSQSRLCTPWSE